MPEVVSGAVADHPNPLFERQQWVESEAARSSGTGHPAFAREADIQNVRRGWIADLENFSLTVRDLGVAPNAPTTLRDR
jgi:hypothetical protein